MSDTWITIAATEMKGDQITPLRGVGFQPDPAHMNRFRARAEPAALTYLQQRQITHDRERCESTIASGAIGHSGRRGAQSRRLPMGGAETQAVTAVLATNRRALPVNWARKPITSSLNSGSLMTQSTVVIGEPTGETITARHDSIC